MGQLLEISTKRKTRVPMESWQEVTVDVVTGIQHEDRSHSTNRQITIVSREAWDAVCRDLDNDVPWTYRRANLLIEGIEFKDTTGQQIQISDVTLEIMGETDPCERMEEQEQGLFEAMVPDWRGGVMCKIIEGGTVQIGNRVQLIPHSVPA